MKNILLACVFGYLTIACGGGLSHTVPDKDVAAATGEDAAKLEAARAAIAAAKADLSSSRSSLKAAEKDVDAAEKVGDKADSMVDKAEDKVEKAEDQLEKSIDLAKNKRDAAIEAAKATFQQESNAAKIAGGALAPVEAKRDAAIKAAKELGESEIAAAKAQMNPIIEQAKADLKGLRSQRDNKALSTDVEEAKAETSEAQKAVNDAKVWAARAKYELLKYETVTAMSGKSGPAVTERLLEFKEQLAEKEAELLDAEKELLDAQKDLESSKDTLIEGS